MFCFRKPANCSVCADTLHTMPSNAKFSSASSLGITLYVQKYYFVPVKMWYICQFFIYSTNCVFIFDRLLVTKCPRIQFQISCLLSCLLWLILWLRCVVCHAWIIHSTTNNNKKTQSSKNCQVQGLNWERVMKLLLKTTRLVKNKKMFLKKVWLRGSKI